MFDERLGKAVDCPPSPHGVAEPSAYEKTSELPAIYEKLGSRKKKQPCP
ncbi:MAG: hypothetical protein QM750_08610 [Rubrivivax sp.]